MDASFESACVEAFENLGDIQEGYRRALDALKKEQGQREAVFSRLSAFPWAEVNQAMNAAQNLLTKDGYQVAMLGTFSSGKSLLANGLLESPRFLPSSQGVCTLTVSEIEGTRGVKPEGVKVDYLTLEQAYLKVFGSEQFTDQLGPRVGDLSPFEESRAADWVREAVAAYEQSDQLRENAARLASFLEATQTYRDKLGTTQFDAIENKDHYLSAQAGNEGHLFLIGRVYITVENDMLSAEEVALVDLPGVDAPSAHDKEVTYAAIPSTDAALLIVPERGFTMDDRELVKRVADLQGDVKNKIFLILNKLDTLNEDQLSNFEQDFWPDLEGKLQQMGLSVERVYFTSAYLEELRLLKDAGNAEGAAQFAQVAGGLANKRQLAEQIQDPLVRSRIMPALTDGGVRKLRDDLHAYLHGEIKRERLRTITNHLETVRRNLQWLIEPEKAQLGSDDAVQRERVAKFFNETSETYRQILAALMDQLPAAMAQLTLKGLKEPALRTVASIIDAMNFGIIKEQVPVQMPVNIRQQALTLLKPRLASTFEEMALSNIPGQLISKLQADFEQAQFEAPRILKHFAEAFGEDYDRRYENEWQFFTRSLLLLTRLRIQEVMRPIDQLVVGAQPGEPPQWTPRLEEEFKDTLRKTFTEKFSNFADQLGVLTHYYRALLGELANGFERLLDEIHRVAREKYYYAVALPQQANEHLNARERLLKLAELIGTPDNRFATYREKVVPSIGL